MTICNSRIKLLLLTITTSISILSCKFDSSTYTKSKILGKWRQIETTSLFKDSNDMLYEFLEDNNFIIENGLTNDSLTSRKGVYEIKNDSLLLFFNGGTSKDAFSIKVVFNTDTNMSFFKDTYEYRLRKQ